ncbi:hypothetical protein PENCOP_c005G01255 [Penicillium coprophilum]|uniref:Malonyl-CoA:ACP transacylase (MAT) domain-containing protein n=1 Tax=Penicillium coprophilum TaxID=36646 RepID=A0A1V6USF9_9EURO|nr:hypothetical protein PENCOP_c005G01255 [Penicillium coprophilum]
MGRELFHSSAAFEEVVRNLEPIIQAELGFSTIESLQAGCPHRTDVIQAMTFLMHLGIAAVLEAESGPPTAVYSLYREYIAQGAMALVRLPASEVRARIATHPGASVAIEASPTACIEVHTVATDVPFHTPLLAELAGPLRDALKGELHPQVPHRALYSTSLLDPRSDAPRNAEYWVMNMVQPVQPQSTVDSLVDDGFRAFVELASHPIITHSIVETITERTSNRFIVTPTMVRKQPVLKCILAAVGRLHCFGCTAKCTDLDPTAPWSSSLAPSHNPAANDLLGTRTALWGTDEVLYQTRLGSWLRDRACRCAIAYLLRAISPRTVENVSLQVPVVVSPAREVQIRHNTRSITITSRLEESTTNEDGSWLVNTTATVGAANLKPSVSYVNIAEIRKKLPRTLSENLSMNYLASVARVDANPDNVPGMDDLWTVMDAATSIASTLWYCEPRLRIPTAVRRVVAVDVATPQVVYIHCRKKQSSVDTADVIIGAEDETILVEIQGMVFAGVEGESLSRKTTSGLVHQISWLPAVLVEEPLEFAHIAFLTPEATKAHVKTCQRQLERKVLAFVLAICVPQIPQGTALRYGLFLLQVTCAVRTFIASPPPIADRAILYSSEVLMGNMLARYFDQLYTTVPEKTFHRVVDQALEDAAMLPTLERLL